MAQRQLRAHGHALLAQPGLDGLVRLIEGDVLARGVAGARKCHRVQMPTGQHGLDAAHVQMLT